MMGKRLSPRIPSAPSSSLPVISGIVAADGYLSPSLDIVLDWESFLPLPHLSRGHPTSVPGWYREIWLAFTNFMPLQRKAYSSFRALGVNWDWVEMPISLASPCVLACSTTLPPALVSPQVFPSTSCSVTVSVCLLRTQVETTIV